MSVLIDTTIWSLALRRRPPDLNPDERAAVAELRQLLHERRIVLLGAVRQELLSGVASPPRFAQIRDYLRDFTDETLDANDYEHAAEYANLCRSHGIQGANTDFLICAVAERLGAPIFTTDGDFTLYARHLPITLHQPGDSQM